MRGREDWLLRWLVSTSRDGEQRVCRSTKEDGEDKLFKSDWPLVGLNVDRESHLSMETAPADFEGGDRG